MKRNSCLAVLALSLTFLIATPAMAAAKKNAAAVPFSDAFGQSMENWLRDFWAWNFGGVGPQVQPNGVFFMPIPTPGSTEEWDGKPIGIGEMNLTVKPGNKLVLGILSWIGETYDPAYNIADDAPWPMSNFLPPEGEVVITLDGVEIINSTNLKDFYFGPVSFKEPIMYAEPTSYHSIGAIYVQGIGIVLKPMTPGKHTLTLYSWDRWQGFYGPNGQGWFNTWHITVAPQKK
jgi:hypothetical protein